MKKSKKSLIWRVFGVGIVMVLVCIVAGVFGTKTAWAASEDVILEGVYMGDIDLSGLTADEARAKVNEYVESLKAKNVTFNTIGEHYVSVTAGNLGLTWDNEGDIDAAVALGKKGNIVKRYKAIQDLKHGNKVYNLKVSLDRELVRAVLTEQCTEYDVQAVNATMKKVDGQFVIEEGQAGEQVNIEESLNKIYDYLTTEWNYQDASIDLVIEVAEPKGKAEDLAKLTDVLGTYTTDYSTSPSSRCMNVENGCQLINGTLLYPGEEFSTYNSLKPFTRENGYYPAAAYANGKVVDSIGGGICQVSTTLYNAVLLAELNVVERNNHSMIVTYVKPSMDATIAESSGKDFRFTNNLDNPIYIEGYTEGKNITFTIYGVETRSPNRTVRYESEVLSTVHPDHEVITAAAGQGIGYISVESAHVGYTAQLWKVVEENGVQVSREIINNSTYKVSPRSAVVGVSTDNPNYAARMQAAIASGSIDTCKAEAAAIKAEIAAGVPQQPEPEPEPTNQELLLQQQQAAAQQAELEATNPELLLQQQQQAEIEAYNQALLLQQQQAAAQQAIPTP